jgi:Ca2+-binding EF-hand superfamily protein
MDTSLLCLDADNCVKTVDEVFRDFDRDRSGQMDFDEYLAAMKRLRVFSTLARQLFEAADLPDGGVPWKKMRSAQFGARE